MNEEIHKWQLPKGGNMEKICKASEIDAGTMKGFMVNQKPILVANLGGNYYAVDSICPHRYGYLPKGKLEKNITVCPVHGAQYDVTTGKLVKDVPGMMKMATGGGASDLTSYKVEIRGDFIFIDVK
jgi:3-phenylpropionate/trans-cinnamate dioxygenase ferredoxin component